MSVSRFTGNSSRDVMRQVRAALGDDALILANRRTDEGVEILAMADDAIEGMTARVPASQASSSPLPYRAPSASDGEAALHAMSERLLSEMQDMRALLAREQTRHSPESGALERLRRLLREAGFSTALADELLANLPEELSDTPADDARPLAWLQRCLANRLAVLDNEDHIFEPPGILALIGPTGVGKTTTTAKLAARFVQRHGADRVALVTTDSFRIGAHEQLRIYAELLGIPMYALAPDQPVDSLASRLVGRRWVIIDTVGMSQRDQRVVEQVAMLHAGHVRVQMLLLLNAASQPETLDEVITRYRQAAKAAGERLDNCLLTKQDEACRLAPAFEAIVRHGLRLTFVSHGQRVPEDLCLPDAGGLAARALATRSPLPLDATGLPPAPAGKSSPAAGLLGQGRQLAVSLSRLRRRLNNFTTLEAAWDLAELPGEQQRHQLDRLLNHGTAQPQRAGIYWSSRRPVSGSWRMPDLGLDDRGDWMILPTLQHRQTAGEAERLAAAIGADIGVHLFAGLPEAATRDHLAAVDIRWACRLTAGQRVWHRAERHPLSRLSALATPAGELSCRLAGKSAVASLAQLPIALTSANRLLDSGTDNGQALRAWFAELREAESGRPLGKRYWLTSATKNDDAPPLLLGLLHAEGLPRHTRQAHALLADWLPETVRPLRLLLSTGIAAAAAHLDQAQDEDAMDLRAELLGMLAGRRRRRDTALLMAVLQLFSARDAIRRLQTVDAGAR